MNVTFKTARKAKNRGFDEPCRFICRYTVGETPVIDELIDFIDIKFCKNSGNAKNDYAIPTQSDLQKWLREKHNLVVEIKFNEGLFRMIHKKSTNKKAKDFRWNVYMSENVSSNPDVPIYHDFSSNDTYDTYEQALENGLWKALKMIR